MGNKDYQRFLRTGMVHRSGRFVPVGDVEGTEANREKQGKVDKAVAEHFRKKEKRNGNPN